MCRRSGAPDASAAYAVEVVVVTADSEQDVAAGRGLAPAPASALPFDAAADAPSAVATPGAVTLQATPWTHARAELYAVMRGLDLLAGARPQATRVAVHTRAVHAVRYLQRLMPVWKRRGWRTCAGAPAPHADLLIPIDRLCARFADVAFLLEGARRSSRARRLCEAATTLLDAHDKERGCQPQPPMAAAHAPAPPPTVHMAE
jgi:ribonuclease HI